MALLSVTTAGPCCAGLLGLSNPSDIDAKAGAYLRGSAFAGSTLGALHNLEDSAALQPRSGANLALVDVQLAAGYRWERQEFGWVYRQEWLAQTSADTMHTYQALQGVRSAPALSRSDVAYELYGLQAQGIQWASSFDHWQDTLGLRLGLRTSLLVGNKARRQSAFGVATTDAASVLTVTGTTIDQNTSTDTAANGFQPRFLNPSIQGSGYSVDVGAQWTGPNDLVLSLTLDRLANAMVWNNVPETTLSGTSVYNGQFPGGHKVLSDFTQTLPTRTEVRATLPWGRYKLDIANENMAGYDFTRLGVSMAQSNGWRYGVDYDLFFGTTGLTFERPGLSLQLRWDLSGASRAAGLQVLVSLP